MQDFLCLGNLIRKQWDLWFDLTVGWICKVMEDPWLNFHRLTVNISLLWLTLYPPQTEQRVTMVLKQQEPGCPLEGAPKDLFSEGLCSFTGTLSAVSEWASPLLVSSAGPVDGPEAAGGSQSFMSPSTSSRAFLGASQRYLREVGIWYSCPDTFRHVHGLMSWPKWGGRLKTDPKSSPGLLSRLPMYEEKLPE